MKITISFTSKEKESVKMLGDSLTDLETKIKSISDGNKIPEQINRIKNDIVAKNEVSYDIPEIYSIFIMRSISKITELWTETLFLLFPIYKLLIEKWVSTADKEINKEKIVLAIIKAPTDSQIQDIELLSKQQDSLLRREALLSRVKEFKEYEDYITEDDITSAIEQYQKALNAIGN